MRTLVIVAAVYFAFHVAAIANDKITFLFGELSFEIERALVPEQPSPTSRRYSQDDWRRVTEHRMEPGQGVWFRVPLADAIPSSSRCRKINLVELAYQTLPGRGAPKDYLRRDLWTPMATDFPDVSRLIDPSGKTSKILEIYQFEVDDLRDYWGDKQTFSNRKFSVLLTIQIARDASFHASLPADGCFFRDGIALTRHFRSFVLDRLKGNL